MLRDRPKNPILNFLEVNRDLTQTDEGQSSMRLFNILAFSLTLFYIANSIALFIAGAFILGSLLISESLLFASVILFNRSGKFLISKNLTTIGLLMGVVTLGGALGEDGFGHILLFPVVISQFIIFNRKEVVNRNFFIVFSLALFFVMEFYPITFGDDPHLSHAHARYLEFWIFLVSFFANGLAVYYFLELNYSNRAKIKNYLANTEDLNIILSEQSEKLKESLEQLSELNVKLESNEKLFRFLSENSKDIIVLIGSDCKIRYASPSAKELLGYDSEDILNNDIELFIVNDDLSAKKDLLDKLSGEIRLKHKNGNSVWFDVLIVKVEDEELEGYQISLREISDRKKVEEELVSNRSMIDRIAETTPNFLYVFHHKEKRINYLNRNIWEYLGYNLKELFEMDEYEFHLIHPEDKAVLESKYNELLKSPVGKVISSVYRMKNAKGEWIWFESRDTVLEKTPIKDEIILSLGEASDITEIKRNEEFLLKKQNELLSFVQAAPAAIAMMDKDMNYIAASSRWYLDYKLLDKSIIGKNHYDLFHNISDEWKKIHQDAIKGRHQKADEDFFMKENEESMWLRWEVIPWYKNQDEIGGIIMLTEDITQKKKEKEELEEAKRKAEEASEAKAQFLSTMSHEIRTPLNSVIGMTNILLMDNPKEDQLENLKALSFGAESLMTLINDILDFSKIEAGKIKFEKTEFGLQELLKNLSESFKVLARGQDIEIILDYSEKIPKRVIGDPTRLGQILNNLVGNSVKFTQKGYVKIEARLKSETVNEIQIEFKVSDTGIGIPLNKQKLIFDSFSQASSETTRKFGGTGLGLAITKRLVDLQNGDIGLTSILGEGTTFTVNLTYLKSLNQEEEQQIKFVDQDDQIDNYHILLVEDNKMNQLVATKFLKKWGLSFEIAENGKEAVELVKKGNFNLVLMDLHMPEMDGYEATNQIRQFSNPKKNTPIVALSASAGPGVKERITEFGINDFVAKPFNPKDLFEAIKRNAKKIPQA